MGNLYGNMLAQAASGSGGGNFLPLTGGTLSGNLKLPSLTFTTTDIVISVGTGGSNKITIGESSTASGSDGIAIGDQCVADDCVSIGFKAESGVSGVAIGFMPNCSAGSDAVAIGSTATASDTNTIAIGNSTTAEAESAICIGNNNSAFGIGSIAIGTNIMADESSVSIGESSSANATGAVAVGGSTTANANSSIGIGYTAIAAAQNAIAIGTNTSVTGNTSTHVAATNSVAIGNDIALTAANAFWLGNNSHTVYSYKAVSVRSDERDKKNIADIEYPYYEFIMGLRPVNYQLDMREAYRKPVKILEDGSIYVQPLSEVVADGSKMGTRRHNGFISQEVKALADRLGFDFPGFNDQSVKGGEDIQSLIYEQFIPPIVKVIQDQDAKIKSLENEIDAIYKLLTK